MASITLKLPNIAKNTYMTWTFATQAGNQICVTLKDSATTYVNNACRQSTTFGIIPGGQGFAQVQGTGVNLYVNVPNSGALIAVTNAFALAAPDGTNVGFGYNFAIEDGSDNDFNDLYATVVAWNSQG
jgi:hypothetical protein